jgi:predicted AlkP superfamily phosphohydrolase/phosphomutase
MRTLVMGLDCAAPEILLENDLPHLRRLMAGGVYGTLESVIPPITVPAWMCMATSQDPGSLGIYGFRNRVDHSYGGLRTVDSRWIRAQTLWDQIAMEGGRSILIGVPPSYPPGRMNGIRVGCFLTPDSREGTFTHPPEVSDRIRDLVGDYPVDVQDFRTEDKDRLHREIVEMTRTHFQVVRHFLQRETWDYFQFVEIGLDRIHHGFWKHHDPRHRHHDPDSPWKDVVREYYRLLDHEIGSVLDLLEEDTLLLVVSDHGAKPLDGGVCVNEWLVREGFLTLRRQPREVTPFQELDVDWGRTRAWSTGGYYARVFLNVKGREPEGVVEPGDVEALREELASRLEALPDDRGRPMATRAYEPESIYRRVEGMPPDLIVHFGDLSWRAIGGVGYDSVHVQENDTGPDDCNHAQHGAFILAGPGVPVEGRVDGGHLLDVAPTLLRAGGYDVPASMQGRDLLGSDSPREKGKTHRTSDGEPRPVDGEALVRERLKGLGYIG